MTNSDMIIMFVTEDSHIHLENRYTENSHETPKLMDNQHQYDVIATEISDGITRFRFVRQINPCDNKSKPIMQGTVKIIYAWNDNSNSFQFHGAINRGSKPLNLLTGESIKVPMPHDVKQFDIIAEEYVITEEMDTFYLCKIVKLPDLDPLYHIVAFAPILTIGNEE
eukprot:260746_1